MPAPNATPTVVDSPPRSRRRARSPSPPRSPSGAPSGAPPGARQRARAAPDEAATGLLSLGGDELGLLLEHVDYPFMLKLACRATRDAAPTATETPRSAVVARVPLLQWARANGCPWDEETCSAAAEGGHLAVLQWARAEGCDWDAWTCERAARGGHLAVLQWARGMGCPWDTYTCSAAAEGGNLAVLQWARAEARAASPPRHGLA
jgi:hypothetical protein